MIDPTVELIAAFVVGTLAVARATRLLVDDDWPPSEWVREQYIRHVPEPWQGLVECPFCAAPWFALADLLLGWWSFNGDGSLDWWWWLPNLWFAAAYLASMITVRDIPKDDR